MATNTLTTNPKTAETVQQVRYSRLWWVGLMAIVLATIANVIVRAIALPFITVPPEFMPVSIAMPAIIFTIGGVLAAVIVFAIVGRFSRQPARTFTIIAVVALLLSLVPNVMMLIDPASAPFPGGNLGSITVLMIQHIVAAVIAVWVLTTQAVETRS
jgi:hypothetical protein